MYNEKQIVLVGYQKDLVKALIEIEYAKKVIIVETKDLSLLTEMDRKNIHQIIVLENLQDRKNLKKIIEELKKVNKDIQLYPAYEFNVEICGYLRTALDIKGITENEALLTRDKYKMKQLMKKCGIKTAVVSIVKNKKDISDFCDIHGFPVILKPRYGAATENTFIIRNEKDLTKEILEFVQGNVEYIIETFIKGTEYHCDSIVSRGNIVFASVGMYGGNLLEGIETKKPVSSIIFSDYDRNILCKSIKEFNEKVTQEIGISNGVFHLEVFVNAKNEIFFGEIASRIGGGAIGRTLKYSHNLDIYKEYYNVNFEKEITQSWKDSEEYHGFVYLPTKQGEIKAISKESDFWDIDGILEVVVEKKIGDYLEGGYNTAIRSGHVILKEKSVVLLQKKIQQVIDRFQLITVQKDASDIIKELELNI